MSMQFVFEAKLAIFSNSADGGNTLPLSMNYFAVETNNPGWISTPGSSRN